LKSPFIRLFLASLLLTMLVTSCQPKAQPDVKDPLWWKDATFYEIFVRSFADSNGDGIGDFNGITAKLDYLNDGKPETTTDLGITAIWLMPINPSPSYHGYDVTDYLSVNPQYGNLEDFKNLLTEAHKRGIHIIMDFVINHTSIQHPWFVASAQNDPKYRDYYVWSANNPGYKGPWDENVWFDKNGAWYYAVFDPGMPDLNYRNPAVTDEIHKVAQFWLKDVGVDGLRIDGAKHIVEDGAIQVNTPETHAWFKDFYTFDKGIAPNAMTVGEIWDTTEVAAAYPNNDEMDLVFNFPLADGLAGGVNFRDGQMISKALEASSTAFKDSRYGSFLTNHDMARLATRLQNDMPKVRAATTLLLTSPGVPFIYYGEEIGMTGGKPDELIRTPMQWTPDQNSGFTTGTPWEGINILYPKTNVQTESAEPQSLLTLYRNLIQVRNTHYALRTGQYIQVDTNNSSLYAALRVAEKESILILVNLSKDPLTNPRLFWAQSPLSGSYNMTPLLVDGKLASPKFTTLKVGAQGAGADYQPLPEIPANASLILLLQK